MILEDVRADNWRACTALEVEESQQRFVAPVANYLAHCAYGDSPWHPLAVRIREEVVGFVMWGVDPADESFWIGVWSLIAGISDEGTAERWSLDCSNGLRRTDIERRR